MSWPKGFEDSKHLNEIKTKIKSQKQGIILPVQIQATKKLKFSRKYVAKYKSQLF